MTDIMDTESKLVGFVIRGELLDLVGEDPVDESAKRSWDESHTVPADVIRSVLRGQLPSAPDPKGLRLRGARIAGSLDLENLTTDVWLDLSDCFLPDGLVARDASLPGLSLDGCLLEHPSASPVAADRLRVSAFVSLSGSVLVADTEAGALRLTGARIGGDLDCSGAKIRNESGSALYADDLQVDRDLVLGEGFEAVGTGDGAVDLSSASVGGRFLCWGAKIRNESGAALVADGLQVDRDLVLGKGFEAIGAGDGAVLMPSAHVGGYLDCSGAKIRNDSGSALYADGLQVDRGLVLGKGFEAIGAGDGAVRLPSAHVGGYLDCSGAKIRNDSGSALYADGLQVDRDLVLGEGFEAVGTGDGAVDLSSASVGGRFLCWGAKIRNESGAALVADGLQVDRDLVLGKGFEAIGAGDGAVRLPSAHVGGYLDCSGANIRNESGSALYADGLQVDRNLVLGEGFEATSKGEVSAVSLAGIHVGGDLNCSGGKFHNEWGSAFHADGLQVAQNVFLRNGFEAVCAYHGAGVRLRGAHIGGDLDCSGGKFLNELGPAFDGDSSRVGRNLFLRRGFEAISRGEAATVNLPEAHIGGVIEIERTGVENQSHPQARFLLDGLTYSGIPIGVTSADEWLELLREETPDYTAQPYQQLASVYRATGQDSEVRKVLMEQRRRQIRSKALSGPAARTWARLTGFALGYGYQPWRALVGLAAVLMVAVLITVFSDTSALTHTTTSPAPGAACSTVERVGIGLDIGLPLIKTGARTHCDITDTPAGDRLKVVGWALQVFAWAFATLFIAGFTGAVRKT